MPARRPVLIVFALTLALNLGLRLAVAARPVAALDGWTIPDDTYLALHLARSIAHHQGPFYETGYTNGFQPLYVFLLVPAFWASDSLLTPLHVGLVLLSLCDTLALALWMWVLARVTRGWMAPAVLAAAWVLNPYEIGTTVNGLETALAGLGAGALFACVLWRFGGEAPDESRAHQLLLGAVAGIAVLARIDNLLLVAALGVWILVRHAARPRQLVASLPLVALGAGLTYGPWLLYSYHYAHALYPVSGRAVRFQNIGRSQPGWTFVRSMIHNGAIELWHGERAVILCAAAALCGVVGLVLFERRRLASALAPHRALAPLYLFAVGLFFAYTSYIFAPWFFGRYLFPCATVLALCLAALVATLYQWAGALGRALLVGIFVLGLSAAEATGGQLAFLYTHQNDNDRGYMNLGLWARRHFPPGTVVGSAQSGALGYFADDLRVVNLDGVVNADCYHALYAGRGAEYIRRAKVEYILGWRANMDMLRSASPHRRPGEWVYQGLAPGFRSWAAPWEIWRVRR